MTKIRFTLLLQFILCFSFFSQEINNEGEVSSSENTNIRAFSGTRIISAHSVEVLPKRTMDFRIEHRFGDMFGTNGGPQNMFGFDNLSDMRIALEYGLSDRLMLGVGRSKGTGAPYRSLLDGFLKYRALSQGQSSPVSISIGLGSTFTYMKASEDISQVSHFPSWQHRFAYYSQVNVTRTFGDNLSLALLPTLTHRNYVAANDQNMLFSIGSAARIKLSGRFALIAEYFHSFAAKELRPSSQFKQSLGVALEWTTFGHNFTINFTNATGLGETQFIPYNTSDWLKGQFRFGFCVSRKFEFE